MELQDNFLNQVTLTIQIIIIILLAYILYTRYTNRNENFEATCGLTNAMLKKQCTEQNTSLTGSKLTKAVNKCMIKNKKKLKPCPEPANKIKLVSDSKKTTPANDGGGGDAIYLDRHDIDCGDNKVLSRIHLARVDDHNYHYEYTCSDAGKISTPVDKSTPANSGGGGNALYLDRHNIDCGDNSLLTRMHLAKTDNYNYHYEYKCATPPANITCRTASTPSNDDGGGDTIYLDRHDIKCNSDEAISQLHLARTDDHNYHYDYKCCKYK